MMYQCNDCGEVFDEDTNAETTRIMLIQNMLNQLRSQVEDNGWYLHTDSYYYYVGAEFSDFSGGGH